MLRTLALVEIARGILPPESPEVLRAIAGLTWRFEGYVRRPRGGILTERARASGASTRSVEGMVREALDLDLQRRLEELILPRVEPEWLDRYAVTEPPGEAHGTLLIGLSSPHPLIAVAALSTVFPAMGSVPPLAATGTSWAARRLQAHFDHNRAQMRVLWLAPEQLTAHLANGHPAFVTTERIAGGPLAPAHAAHLAIVGEVPTRPVLVHRARDKRWRISVGERGSFVDTCAALAQHAARWPGQHLAG